MQNISFSGSVWVLLLSVVLLVTQFSTVDANPYFQRERSYRKREQPRQGRTYDEIARVINPNPYANVGGAGPFPAQPFWTYAG